MKSTKLRSTHFKLMVSTVAALGDQEKQITNYNRFELHPNRFQQEIKPHGDSHRPPE